MADFTRLDVRTVEHSLILFGRENNIYVGIDKTDERPNIRRYICYHTASHKSCVLAIDYELIENLDTTINNALNYLREYFCL